MPLRCGAVVAFTMFELVVVVLIMSILSVAGMDAISSFEANQARADRAARQESLTAFRCARAGLAMSTGKKAKVAIDTANGTVSVFWQSNGTTYDVTAYATSMTASGTWAINMNTSRELVGTTITLTPAATTYFEYSALGTCAQTGTVSFVYASKTKSLVITNVGDPQLQ